MISDLFGDGWGVAQFYLLDNGGNYASYYPTCDINPVYIDYCFTPGDDITELTALIHGYEAAFYEEIYWQAYIPATGELYTGNYGTTLKFKLVLVNGVYTIVLDEANSVNIIPNVQTW